MLTSPLAAESTLVATCSTGSVLTGTSTRPTLIQYAAQIVESPFATLDLGGQGSSRTIKQLNRILREGLLSQRVDFDLAICVNMWSLVAVYANEYLYYIASRSDFSVAGRSS
jgi:hypothetical protein